MVTTQGGPVGLPSQGSRPGSQVPVWTVSRKAVEFHLVARPTLWAVPDPPRLRIGTEMHVRIIGWIVGGLLFGPVLRSTANLGRKIIVGYENGNGLPHRAQLQSGRGRNTA